MAATVFRRRFDYGTRRFALPKGAAGPTSAPDAVDDLATTPGDTEAVLTWTAPADDGSAITDYVVEYRVAP